MDRIVDEKIIGHQKNERGQYNSVFCHWLQSGNVTYTVREFFLNKDGVSEEILKYQGTTRPHIDIYPPRAEEPTMMTAGELQDRRGHELRKQYGLTSIEISVDVAEELRATREWEDMCWVFRSPQYEQKHHTLPWELCSWSATHVAEPSFRTYVAPLGGNEYIVCCLTPYGVQERRMAIENGVPRFTSGWEPVPTEY